MSVSGEERAAVHANGDALWELEFVPITRVRDTPPWVVLSAMLLLLVVPGLALAVFATSSFVSGGAGVGTWIAAAAGLLLLANGAGGLAGALRKARGGLRGPWEDLGTPAPYYLHVGPDFATPDECAVVRYALKRRKTADGAATGAHDLLFAVSPNLHIADVQAGIEVDQITTERVFAHNTKQSRLEERTHPIHAEHVALSPGDRPGVYHGVVRMPPPDVPASTSADAGDGVRWRLFVGFTPRGETVPWSGAVRLHATSSPPPRLIRVVVPCSGGYSQIGAAMQRSV